MQLPICFLKDFWIVNALPLSAASAPYLQSNVAGRIRIEWLSFVSANDRQQKIQGILVTWLIAWLNYCE